MAKMPVNVMFSKSIEELNQLEGLTIQRFGATGTGPLDKQFEDNDITVKRYVGVYPSQMDDIDFSPILDKSNEELRLASLECSIAANRFLKEVKKDMDQVAKYMAQIRCYDALLKMRSIPPLEHSHNLWKNEQESFLETEKGSISNAVYEFSYRHSNERGYGRKPGDAWYLTWSMTIRSANPDKCPIRLAGQDRKRFTDKDEMIAYLAGRQKKFESCFQEDFPPVPKTYKQLFSYAGMMLPGYKLEEEDQDHEV